MPVVTVSSKGQLVIPKEVRDTLGIRPRQKVLLKVVNNHAEIEPLPHDPIEHFCGIFKGHPVSLTAELLKDRKEDARRDEKDPARLLRGTKLPKRRA